VEVPKILKGVNQRKTVRMTDEEVAEFLQNGRWFSFCTHNKDGTIHAVAMAYAFLSDGTLAFEAKPKSQKIVNLRRDPRMTVLLDDGTVYGELRGVQLVGRGVLTEDQSDLREFAVSLYSRYFSEQGAVSDDTVEQFIRNRVLVKMVVDKTISWDHRKLKYELTDE
jgi:general stress protein 26